MSTSTEQVAYIEDKLISEIVAKLPKQKLVHSKVDAAPTINGFMSAMYHLEITTVDEDEKKHDHHIILKFMKGDVLFRESSKSYIQFENEILIYSQVIPYFREVIRKSGSSIDAHNWIPHTYYAKYGKIEGLGDGKSPESVLAVENLCPSGYRCGPRLHLDKQHLTLMIKTIAEYHSLSYALKIRKDPRLEEFKKKIVPLPFVSPNGDDSKNFYDILYKVAFERFFKSFDKLKDSCDDKKLVEDINRLRKYYNKPIELLERIRTEDDFFAVILHGDYCRNNVLFKYESKTGFDNPKDIKMIDFQELRYSTPAIDLFFFMYMNMDPATRNESWAELLKYYHTTLITSIAEILGVNLDDESLKPYSFEKFNEHFHKCGFYGAMICIHFLPWMMCSEEECNQISYWFETDMRSKEFHKLSLDIGGDVPDLAIFDVVKHASKMGYMQYF